MLYQNGVWHCEKDIKEAERLYRLAAYEGDSSAQNSLAECYCTGIGVEKDTKEAVLWYRLAAGQGNLSAQKSLGDYYQGGVEYREKTPKKRCDGIAWC